MLTEQKAHEFCKKAIDLKNDIEVDFLRLGAMLMKIQDDRLYEAGWDSWEEYTMELKMSPSTISKLIRIYKIFFLRFGIPEERLAQAGGWSVIAEYLPLVKIDTKPQDVKDWITGAVHMPRQDIRRSIVEKKKGVDMTKCKHKNAYTIKVCPDCGDRWRI